MTGRDVPEDHQGGDAAPAAVTGARSGGDQVAGRRVAHFKPRRTRQSRGQSAIFDIMFGHQPGDGPFTCDDDGKPIT